MSDQFLKTKGKKLRRRSTTLAPKGPALSKAETIHKQFADKGLILNDRLKEDRFYILLKRLSEGRIGTQTVEDLMKVPEERLVTGNIDSAFKASSPLKYLMRVRNACLPDKKPFHGDLIGFRQQGMVKLLDDGGNVYRYAPNKIVYMEVTDAVLLPADLRKWYTTWSKLYLRATMIERASNNKSNLGDRPQNIFAGGVPKLHQIRKINQYPGKKQLITQQRKKEVYDMDAVANPATKVKLFNY